MSKAIKIQKRDRRHQRVRAKISGTSQRPRLCVFRSNQHIYVQLIDDVAGKTLIAASDLEIRGDKGQAISDKGQGTRDKGQHKTKSSDKAVILSLAKQQKTKDLGKQTLAGKTAIAFAVGKLISQKALKKKLKQVIFDRGGYKYHGRVKALAQGARSGGLKF